MKSLITILAVFALVLPSYAGKETAKKTAGPNGGRVITSVQPNLEFFVTKERKVEIIALSADFKPAKLGDQVIVVTAGDRSKPVKLEFKADGDKLVSTAALPDGNDFPVSVTIKTDAAAKAIYEKFNLNLEKCSGCKLSEYACICGHTH